MSLNSYLNSKFSPSEPVPRRRVCRWLTKAPNSADASPHSAEKVLIITVDGRTLTGTLIACDQVTNLALSDTIERLIRPQGDDEPSTEQPHGLYVVRGDNVVVCGLVDEALDGSIDWAKVHGEPIGSTKHV